MKENQTDQSAVGVESPSRVGYPSGADPIICPFVPIGTGPVPAGDTARRVKEYDVEYQIICVVKDRGHIAQVGTTINGRTYNQLLTVAQVRERLRQGHRFYTVSPSTGRKAYVEAYDTIRSHRDAVTDNNLDNLSHCTL